MWYVFGSWCRRGDGSEWIRGLGLGFTNPVGTGEVFGLRWCRGGVSWGLGTGCVIVGWCYVSMSCESELFV